MPQVPALVVTPSVKMRLRKQLLVKPLPAWTPKEGLVWDAEGRAGESVPEGRVLMVGVERFLGVGVSKVQRLEREQGFYSDGGEAQEVGGAEIGEDAVENVGGCS